MLFFSPYGFPGQGGGGGFFFLSSRRSDGWSTEDPVPPQSVTNNEAGCVSAYFPLVTPEITNWVLADGDGQGHRMEGIQGAQPQEHYCATDEPALVEGEPQGFQNLFLHDPGAAVEAGSYQLIDTPPLGAPVNQSACTPRACDAWAQGASEDLSHVVFTEAAQLTAEAPEITEPTESGPTNDWSEDLYVWSGGTVRLVTVLPGGSAAAGTLANGNVPHQDYGGRGSATWTHAISTDAEHVAFEVEVQGNRDLYVRENPSEPQSAREDERCVEPAKACTVHLDASQGGTDPAAATSSGPAATAPECSSPTNAISSQARTQRPAAPTFTNTTSNERKANASRTSPPARKRRACGA